MGDLLSTKQLMDLLQVDRTTIYRMLSDGRLPAVRVGGQWRFSRQAIEAWLDAQNTPSSVSSRKAEATEPDYFASLEALPRYCLQSIQEIFAQTSEVGAVTTDLQGNLLTPFSNPCAFCNLILSTDQGRARCQASWKRLAHAEAPRLETCHAGLTYARGRIMVHGEFIAMFIVGQFVVGGTESIRSNSHLEALSRHCGAEAKELAQAAQGLRVLERVRAERLPSLVQLAADTFSHLSEERSTLLERLRQVAEIAGGTPP